MATGKRARPDDLTHIAQLRDDPTDYHIFHALRVLEAHHADRPRLGQSRRASQDAVRLDQEAELAFPTSTIADYQEPPGKPARLVNRFFGLFGPMGPLPLHMTEYARERRRNFRDTTLIAFANTFTHRIMGLFYRAWAAGQPAPQFDRKGDDSFEPKVAALTGHMGAALQGRDLMPDLAKRYFAGHMASGTRTAEGLVTLLQSFFTVPVQLQQFVGCWLDLEPDDRWQLGQSQFGGALGRSTSIGTRVWSRAAKFRILIGPLTLEEYRRFLPGADPTGAGGIERLEAVVRNYLGDALDWDVNVILKTQDVPRFALGGKNAALGHTTWAGARRDQAHDAADLYLSPPHVLHRQRQNSGAQR